MSQKKELILVTDTSKYELPIGVYSNVIEAGRALGKKANSISSTISRSKRRNRESKEVKRAKYRIYKIQIDEEG